MVSFQDHKNFFWFWKTLDGDIRLLRRKVTQLRQSCELFCSEAPIFVWVGACQHQDHPSGSLLEATICIFLTLTRKVSCWHHKTENWVLSTANGLLHVVGDKHDNLWSKGILLTMAWTFSTRPIRIPTQLLRNRKFGVRGPKDRSCRGRGAMKGMVGRQYSCARNTQETNDTMVWIIDNLS